jgi:hypothetical protein
VNRDSRCLILWAVFNFTNIVIALTPPMTRGWVLEAILCPIATTIVLLMPEPWRWTHKMRRYGVFGFVLLIWISSVLLHEIGILVHVNARNVPLTTIMTYGLIGGFRWLIIFAVIAPLDDDGPGPRLRKRLGNLGKKLKWTPTEQPEAT